MKRIGSVPAFFAFAGMVSLLAGQPARAQVSSPTNFPTAIFPFSERGAGVKGYGASVADILFSSLASRPEITLVERAELEKVLTEAELSLSGIVDGNQAAKVGQLTGARILLTGSVFEVDNQLFVVAKIIGTENGRVLGESANGAMGELVPLTGKLAEKIARTITAEASNLASRGKTTPDRIAAVKLALGGAKRPLVRLLVSEQHVGRPAVDPAAWTELALFLTETGFEIVDSAGGGTERAAVVIEGEGLSEFAVRRGSLVSVKARLEIKARDAATGKLILTDRQTAIVVDLSEQLAGKKALQEAAAAIAERLLPKLVGR